MESPASETNLAVERLAVEELPPRGPRLVRPVPPPFLEVQQNPAPLSPPSVPPIAPSAAPVLKPSAAATASAHILVAILAVSKVVAVRLQLLLALVGAFVLALMAMAQQSYLGLAIFGAYCVLTVIPLVWLAWPDRSKGA